jgi:hypothetical protein
MMMKRGDRYDGIALGSDLNILIEPADWPGIYGNHSCDPNLWMQGPVTVVARHDIPSNQELTVDYAVYTASGDWGMTCNCGTGLCRGEVSGTDWQRRDLQERYRGHFAPVVQTLIDTSAR